MTKLGVNPAQLPINGNGLTQNDRRATGSSKSLSQPDYGSLIPASKGPARDVSLCFRSVCGDETMSDRRLVQMMSPNEISRCDSPFQLTLFFTSGTSPARPC